MDFLATIAPPVVTQPQAFTDAMLDPVSRGLMTSLTTKHMSGATLQRTLRHSADQLQRTVQGQFVSLKVCEVRLAYELLVSKIGPLMEKQVIISKFHFSTFIFLYREIWVIEISWQDWSMKGKVFKLWISSLSWTTRMCSSLMKISSMLAREVVAFAF